MTTLRRGDVIEGRVEKVVYRGMGLMRREGQVVFVRGVYPRERWRVRITGVTKDFARGEAVEPIEKSVERRPSPCSVFPACGGCAHLDLDYAAQLRLKSMVLEDAFARAGVAWRGTIEMTPSPEKGWRSRASIHLERRGTILRLGLKETASHRVIEPEVCLQISTAMNAALADLHRALESRAAFAREAERVELVESHAGDKRIATFFGGRQKATRRHLDDMMSQLHAIDVLGVVSEGTRQAHGIWSGAPYVVSNVRGHSFRTHARSFFQANRFLAEDLVRAVERNVPKDAVVLDLYSGVGFFSLPLASRTKRVIGVEINPLAVSDARANARVSGLANVEFVRGDAREALEHLPRHDDETVVVDPPRGGLPRDIVATLQARRPVSIVYVSCDPPALARDLVRFARAGYELRNIDVFDLFPGTFHVETVACLAL